MAPPSLLCKGPAWPNKARSPAARLIYGWQFLFLGPESALSYALSIGIPKVNTASFKTTPEGLRFMLKRLGRSMAAYALGDRQFMLKLK